MGRKKLNRNTSGLFLGPQQPKRSVSGFSPARSESELAGREAAFVELADKHRVQTIQTIETLRAENVELSAQLRSATSQLEDAMSTIRELRKSRDRYRMRSQRLTRRLANPVFGVSTVAKRLRRVSGDERDAKPITNRRRRSLAKQVRVSCVSDRDFLCAMC